MSFVKHTSCAECGSSDANAVYEDGSTHCFSCGAHKRAAGWKRLEVAEKRAAKPDTRETTELSAEALEWLAPYELEPSELALFRWNPARRHLVYREGSFYNARSFNPDEPKYRSHGPKPYSIRGSEGPIVLVEDLISGIKVARVARSLVLYGSSIPLDRITFKGPAYVFLDFDKFSESMKLSYLLNANGIQCASIVTQLDPKYKSTDELHKLIY